MRVLKVRTSGGMIALNREEAVELRERLRRVRAAQPASETIAVSANASTSVTFTSSEKAAVLDVLTGWREDATADAMSQGLIDLKTALARDLDLDQPT
jgi:hypothetical protein